MKSKLQRGEGKKNETTDHSEHLLILDLALCSPLNRLLTAGNQAHQVKQTQTKLNIPTAVAIPQTFGMLSFDGQIQTTKTAEKCGEGKKYIKFACYLHLPAALGNYVIMKKNIFFKIQQHTWCFIIP